MQTSTAASARAWDGAPQSQPADMASLDILDQAVQLLIQPAVIDGQGMPEPRAEDRSHREEQRVIT